MEFEYDIKKSKSNLVKHGIDFEDIQELWEGEVVTVISRRKKEIRFLSIGRIAGEYWIVIHANEGAAIRIISARRATGRERSYYDREINN